MKKVARVCVLALIMVGFAGCGEKEAKPVVNTDVTAIQETAEITAKDVAAEAEEAKKTAEATKLPEKPKDHPAH